MIQQLIDQHLSAITAQIRAKYPSEMESYAKRLIELGMDADQVEEDMQAVLRTLVMRNESVSDEEFFYILNLFPDYEQFGKQTIEFKITLEGTKSWRKVRVPAILSLTELAYAAIAAFHGMGGHLFTLKLNDKQYSPFEFELGDYENSSQVLLGQLGLKEKSKIEIDYDLGAGWGFNCVVTKLNCEDEPLLEPELISGKGYNLWEDSREYLEFLIEDPKIKVQDWEGRFRQVGKIAKEEGITQFDAEDCDEFPLEMEVLREIYNPANKD